MAASGRGYCSACSAAWAWWRRIALRPVYRGWMRFGLLLSRVTTPLILGIVFFLVITPIGLVRRLNAATTRWRGSFDATAGSYRVPSEKTPVSKSRETFLMIDSSQISGTSCASARSSGSRRS